MASLKFVIVEAFIIALATAMLGVVVNALRADGIPLVANEPYEIFVPCPEGGEVEPIDPGDPRLDDLDSLIVDARPIAQFAADGLIRAINIEFDWLDPIAEENIKRILGAGANRLIVYGDGGEPDNGYELAREIAGLGLNNVYYVEGGYHALLPFFENRGARP
jgi:Rhodanese-like domain